MMFGKCKVEGEALVSPEVIALPLIQVATGSSNDDNMQPAAAWDRAGHPAEETSLKTVPSVVHACIH